MKGKLSRTELIVMAAAALFILFAVALRLSSCGGAGVHISPAAFSAAPAEETGGLIDINTAGKQELTLLSGIGETKAEAVIAYREENGPFASVEEIMAVEGIGPATFEKIKDYITVGESA